ncbi:MAG: putative S-layer protein [Nanoarchaeota archaeon]|nr:putative S-layer protein [Nanoarchaeota archaeon]
MNTKLNTFVFCLLSIVLLASITSAADLTVSLINAPQNVTPNAGSFIVKFNVTYTGPSSSANINFGDSQIVGGTGTIIRPNVILAQNQSLLLDATINFPSHQPANTLLQGIIKAKTGTTTAESDTFSVRILPVESITITKIKDLTTAQNGTINVTNTGNVDLSNINLASSGSLSLIFSPASISSLSMGSSQIVNVLPNLDVSSLQFGSNSATVQATSGSFTSNSVSMELRKSFCKNGPAGTNLTIDRVKITNSGDKDDKWRPLDQVTVDVKFSNDGDDNIEDIIVELGLFDSKGKNIANNFDFKNKDEESINYGTLDNGDSDEVSFEFTVPADFDIGNYRLATKVYSDDTGESKDCIDNSDSGLDDDFFQQIEVERETDNEKFIAFDNIVISPSEASCGDSVTLTVDAFNIGDQDQDQVRINLVNSKLALDNYKEIKGGLDKGDNEGVSFSFNIPKNVKDDTYNLELTADYDYNSRLGEYREHSADSFDMPLKVIGCGLSGQPSNGTQIAVINAVLGSEAKAGSELVVKSTITNTQADRATLLVSALNYDSWATLESVSDRIINLDPGQSKDVTFTFKVDDTTSGEQSFVVEARSGDNTVTREVAVNIADNNQGGVKFPTLNLGNSGIIWIIGIINVILVILIIVVAIRISRR